MTKTAWISCALVLASVAPALAQPGLAAPMVIYAPDLKAKRTEAVAARRTPVPSMAAVYQPDFEPEVTQVASRQGDPGGDFGGGFIEFLFTGRGNPEPLPRPAYTRPWTAQPSAGEPRYSRSASIERDTSGGFDPRFQRQTVDYSGPHGPGTVVIDTSQRFLFLVQPDGKAIRYGVGVGRPGFAWHGTEHITRKAEWPDWTPPPEMLKRRPDLPSFMAGGPANPLGARAMYLGSSMYRIHGSNEPETIGHAVSSGCIRMRNEDVIDLYDRVKVGTKVVVL
jgi:lipoprotein-anchoring transpeptidase ErfK/SrfK